MINKTVLYITLLIFSLQTLTAQEVVTGLQSNQQITRKKDHVLPVKGLADDDTLELPFTDDFSGKSLFPDQTKWTDNFVFINNTYSDMQITTGIATFDAIDDNGRLYEEASSSGFKADQLTSRPLNLNYPSSENIWLSFFYQPGGLADLPEENDSLTLQFFAPEEAVWYSVWNTSGVSHQDFKPVIIKIVQPHFLRKGFRFRFVNYASLSSNPNDPSMTGNCDHWNIDYVVLDRNRNEGDTVYADVAFRTGLRSVLKTHESMPWKQFKQVYLQEMGSFIPIRYRNNDSIIRNVTRNFEIWDEYQNIQSHSFSAGATNIDPLTSIDYNANLIYTFNTDNNDSALFRITATLITDDFDPKENDTVTYYQTFSNYFAFDDGSSEGGYGINGLGSRNAMVAYRFKSFMQDTLRAISICFNDSYLNANLRSFDLMVWNDNLGIPGDLIYTREEVMVVQGENINGFYTYILPDGIMVDDIFYVGWKQRSETFLNAGFDVNTRHEGKQFYWLNGSWNQSQVNGSLMIRPVVGEPLKITSIDDTYQSIDKKIRIWPNPASDFINIDHGESSLYGIAYLIFVDLHGRELLTAPLSERIEISSIPDGFYIVVTSLNGRPISYTRLVKTR
jgi:hypothetical protein